MEIGFDKEVDALLRKARDSGAATAKVPEAHIDADSIAAFAEDALPAAARLSYMRHFADCDRCRRILATVASANGEIEAAAAAPVAAPLMENAVPWYSRLFGRSGMAVAFASLLLLFGGVFVVMLLQRGQESRNDSLAQVEEYQANRAPASSASNTNAAVPAADENSNASANLARLGANAPAANAVTAANGLAVGKPVSTPAARVDSLTAGSAAPVEDKATDKERYAEAEPKTELAAPPPAPAVSAEITTARPRKSDEAEKSSREQPDDDARMSKRSTAESTFNRDSPAPAGKNGLRRSGPLQTQQMNNQVGEMSVNRSVGGRSFSYRDGVWYDSAYRSQGTTNYRRGTEEFDKLDGGVRSIANTLGGTVVVVWKGKAYRIQ